VDGVALLEVGAEDRLINLQGDLLHEAEQMTRWDVWATPFSIELSEALRDRLRGAWKGGEPQRLPGEREPYPRAAKTQS
jgi:hypothetical protein